MSGSNNTIFVLCFTDSDNVKQTVIGISEFSENKYNGNHEVIEKALNNTFLINEVDYDADAIEELNSAINLLAIGISAKWSTYELYFEEIPFF